jgi:hypothetical protein
MKSTGIERIIHKQRTKTCSRTSILHLERLVIGGRHDGVSQWIDRTSSHPHRMPKQRIQLLSGVRMSTPFKRASTTSLLALSTLPEPIGRPAA